MVDLNAYNFEVMANTMAAIRPDLWTADEALNSLLTWAEQLAERDEVCSIGTGGFEFEFDPFSDCFELSLKLVAAWEDGEIFDWTTSMVNVDLAI